MHGDPQHGGGGRIVQVGDTELNVIDHEAQEAQPKEIENGEVRIEEDGRGRNGHAAGSGNAGDDTGRDRGHDGGLCGPAHVNGGEGPHGRVQHSEPAQMQLFGDGEEPARDQVDVFHVPPEALERALRLGAGQGVEKVIVATDDETVEQVHQDLMSGKKQFWAATQYGEFIGCLISEGKKTAFGAVLDLPYMAGKRPLDWLPQMTSMIEPMAIEAGYEGVETHTREGMRKPLINMGWRKTSVRMRRDFNGQQNKNRQ